MQFAIWLDVFFGVIFPISKKGKSLRGRKIRRVLKFKKSREKKQKGKIHSKQFFFFRLFLIYCFSVFFGEREREREEREKEGD
jgi:hypothetical protein